LEINTVSLFLPQEIHLVLFSDPVSIIIILFTYQGDINSLKERWHNPHFYNNPWAGASFIFPRLQTIAFQ